MPSTTIGGTWHGDPPPVFNMGTDPFRTHTHFNYLSWDRGRPPRQVHLVGSLGPGWDMVRISECPMLSISTILLGHSH